MMATTIEDNAFLRACSNCHTRKIRCDLPDRKEYPCNNCSAAGLQCAAHVPKKRPIRSVAREPRQQIPSPRSTEGSSADQTEGVIPVNPRYSSLGAGDTTPHEMALVDSKRSGDFKNDDSIMSSFLQQDFTHEGTIGDYQVTFIDSNVTRFLGQDFGSPGFESDVYHYRDAPFVKRTGGSLPRKIDSSEIPILRHNGAFMFPTRSITESFLSSFVDRVYPLLPIVELSDITKYGQMITASALPPRSIPLLLMQSILMAGSTAFRHPSLLLDQDEVTRRLHRRAKALVDADFEQDRLTLVQAHLLFSVFTSDSCDDTIQNMWVELGAAIRIAQGLGMHRDLGKAKASPSMRRLWKRIWWTLFIYDTLCSFQWGRPHAIQNGEFDVTELTLDDFSSNTTGSLPNPDHGYLVIAFCGLTGIISDWQVQVRSRPGKSVEELSAAMKDTHQKLAEWHNLLPHSLAKPSDHRYYNLWIGSLHMSYNAAKLKLYSHLDLNVASVHEAAISIRDIVASLASQNVLESLWSYGIYDFILATAQFAREILNPDVLVSESGLNNLRGVMAWLESLSPRSAIAKQTFLFYKDLLNNETFLQRFRRNLWNASTNREFSKWADVPAPLGSDGLLEPGVENWLNATAELQNFDMTDFDWASYTPPGGLI